MSSRVLDPPAGRPALEISKTEANPKQRSPHDYPLPAGYTAAAYELERPRLERQDRAREKRRGDRRRLEALAAELLERGIEPPSRPPAPRSDGPAPIYPPRPLEVLRAAYAAGVELPAEWAERFGLAANAAALELAARRLDTSTPDLSTRQTDAGRVNSERVRCSRLQKGASTLTRRRRIQWCGSKLAGDRVELHIDTAGRAGFQGLMRCANRWACPDCMRRMGYENQKDVTALCDRHLATGGDIAFLTLTLPHDYGADLEALRRLVAGAFTRILTGTAWRSTKSKFKVLGQVRALEVTHGRAGWHPHLHVLFLTEKKLSARQLRALHVYAFRRWKDYLTARGIRPPKVEASHMKCGREGVGAYISKTGAALELTRADKKGGRYGSRTPLQILETWVQNHNLPAANLWREWEKGMRGARSLTYSNGIRERYGILKRSDKALAEAEPHDSVAVLELEPAVWNTVRGVDLAGPRILEAAERGYLADGYTAAALEAEAEILAICREEWGRQAERRKLALSP